MANKMKVFLHYLLACGFSIFSIASVDEALNIAENHPFQLLTGMVAYTGRIAELHLMLEDSTGDAAVFECVNGKAKIYHGHQYVGMTNSLTFNKQIEDLKEYKGFRGNKSLPGTTESFYARGPIIRTGCPRQIIYEKLSRR